MKLKSLLAAVGLVSSASIAHAADTDALKYLSAFDPLALRMLTCANLMARDGSRLQGFDRKELAQLSASYGKAGRAAVVRAALEAAGSIPDPKIADMSFTSTQAIVAVTNDLRVHERRAAELTADIRASGFDITSSCVEGTYLGEAVKLNEWFAHDTSVLTKVK